MKVIAEGINIAIDVDLKDEIKPPVNIKIDFTCDGGDECCQA